MQSTKTQTFNRLSISSSQNPLRRQNSSITNFSGSGMGIKVYAPISRPPNHIDFRKKSEKTLSIPKK